MRDRPSDTHRTLTEARLKRKLGPDEIVHHENEAKDDNSAANLTVVPRGAHTASHNRTRGLSKLRASLAMQKNGRKLY
jgi:hypothetical protein